jgi:hypothetical protein
MLREASVGIGFARSADFQSAVSQDSILPRSPETGRLPLTNLQPIGNRRYGRLEICATQRPALDTSMPHGAEVEN